MATILKNENKLSELIWMYNWKKGCKFPRRARARRCFLMCYVWEFFNPHTQQFDIQSLSESLGYTYRATKYILDNQLDLSKYTSKIRGGLIKGGKLDKGYSQIRVQLMMYHKCHSISQLIERYLEAGFDVITIGQLLGYTDKRYQTIRSVQTKLVKRSYEIC